MAAMKKGAKVTDNPKDFMLRVRMDKQIMFKLDNICKTENLTRSEVVRKGIEELYQKNKK